MVERKVCSKCTRKRQLQFFESPRGRVCVDCKKKTRRKSGRKTHLNSKFQITQEEYDALKKAGGDTCWICHGSRPYNLQVDHSHVHEQLLGTRASIRGLLCKRCNKLLRDVGDSQVVLKEAVHYLMTGRIRAQELLNPETLN